MADSYPMPADDAQRVASLRALAVLDSGPEAVFDALARAAAEVCGTPIALLSLVDADRQWFKANVGLEGATETPREQAFCTHAILGSDVMVVEDATRDPRFRDNPLVTGEPLIRFYGGAPVTLSDGASIGTLCVIDRQPHTLSAEQMRILADLGRAAAAALEMRGRSEERMRAAQAAQERFTRLYQATPGMLHSIGMDGRFLSVSDTWLEKMGYAREEVLGRSAIEFMTPASAEFARDIAWPEFFGTGRADHVEYQYVRKDGSVMDVSVSSVLEYDEHGEPRRTLAVLEDVTGRKIAERRLLRNRDRLRSILEGTNVGTWEWNVQTGETRFNERWAEMIGYTLKELEPISIETWSKFSHPDDLAESGAALERHFSGASEYYDCIARMRHKDGHWIWVQDRGRVAAWDENGDPLWMMGTHHDITALKETELALSASKRLLDRTKRIANVGGWSVELDSGRLDWSDHTCHVLGLEPGTRMSLDEALEMHAPEQRGAIEAAMRSAMREGTPWDMEVPLVTASGERKWVQMTGEPEIENGQIVRLVGAVQDITRRREAEQQLAESRELLEITLESIADAVITTDTEGNVRWLNPVAARLTGWSSEDACGRPVSEVFPVVHEDSREPLRDPVSRCLQDREPGGAQQQALLPARDGSEYFINNSASPIRDREGRVVGVVVVFRDVSEQRRMNREMTYRATHDPLTGLVNRSEFEARLSRVLENARARETSNALMYIDLDQFKIVNDSCGHAVGDRLLQQISALLEERVRKRDTLARLGGDEFGVILEHCTVEQAQRVAEQICAAMDEFRFVHDDRRYRVGTSIGLVSVDSTCLSEAAVLQAADSACYAAKEAGRNRVVVWREKDRALRARQGQMQWASRIEQALDEDRFKLFAQHIVPIGENLEGQHCEILLRLENEDSSITMPGAFLPAAERYHLASRVDRWVVEKVFAWLSRAGRYARSVETVSINLSGLSIGDQTFHRFLADMIAGARFDVRRLCLEITETAVITHIDDARRFIGDMREHGIRIALDDFGSGASSFGYLKSLPVNFLKIDGQFIRDLNSDPLDLAAVRCFTEVAGVVGIRTVAEFVEDPAVLETLTRLGVDYAQGFLLHEPEPIELLVDRELARASEGRPLVSAAG